ncbi:hypothetical protein [Colwellia psychrerythraea]|uniref:hypothetical protein n=1 Tax=Colwellia psychrerythraea TaxID=28229 RepID=UPI00051A787B|nr:hypothetical protein [Colwellia psychrerythraea]
MERSFKTDRQHTKHMREIVEEKPDIKSCTKYCAEMVLRKVTKGKNQGNNFGGCSTFPSTEI